MSSDELIFQADRIHSVSIHNVTLVANQINEDGKTADLVIEYQGKQHTLRAAHYVNESDVGKVGYVGVWGAMEPKTNVSPTTCARCLLPRHPPR